MKTVDKSQQSAKNKDNYLKAKDLFNQNKIAECILHYSPDHLIKSMQGQKKGRAGIGEYFEELRRTWPDLQITVEHVLAEGNLVMGRSITRATHTSTILGVPPTNKKIITVFWDLHLFNDDGFIIESWNLIDNLAIMSQIGVLSDKPK
jgi:predicted ester cyclase